ncbi:MAG: cyclase family protein [Thermococci archaeon]|nr:cyclase family protein [Thermococci archaeon]
MEIVDLTLPLEDGMNVYPGDPAVEVRRWIDITEAGYTLNVLRLGEHTGTHVDAPAHVIKDGKTVDELPPDAFMGDGVAVDVSEGDGPVAPREVPEGLGGRIVLFAGSRELSVGAAEKLAEQDVRAVGVETASVGSLEVHRTLLGAGIPVFENLTNVGRLVGKRFVFVGLPLRIRGGSGSPVRAVAVLRFPFP